MRTNGFRAIATLLLLGCRPTNPVVTDGAHTSGSETNATNATNANATTANAEPQCPRRAHVIVRERHPDGSGRSWSLRCTPEATLLGVSDAPPDDEPHEGGDEEEPIHRAEADALWRVVADAQWTRWLTCEAGTGVRWEVEVDDGEQLRIAHCEGRIPSPWANVRDALNDAWSSGVENAAEHWPFGWEWSEGQWDGEYWRDELGYYRAPTP